MERNIFSIDLISAFEQLWDNSYLKCKKDVLINDKVSKEVLCIFYLAMLNDNKDKINHIEVAIAILFFALEISNTCLWKMFYFIVGRDEIEMVRRLNNNSELFLFVKEYNNKFLCPSENSPRIISLEGINGAGKTTYAKYIQSELNLYIVKGRTASINKNLTRKFAIANGSELSYLLVTLAGLLDQIKKNNQKYVISDRYILSLVTRAKVLGVSKVYIKLVVSILAKPELNVIFLTKPAIAYFRIKKNELYFSPRECGYSNEDRMIDVVSGRKRFINYQRKFSFYLFLYSKIYNAKKNIYIRDKNNYLEIKDEIQRYIDNK